METMKIREDHFIIIGQRQLPIVAHVDAIYRTLDDGFETVDYSNVDYDCEGSA